MCATTGNGDAPENAERFWRFVKRRTQPKDMLAKLHYAVLVRGVATFTFVVGGTPMCLTASLNLTPSPQPNPPKHTPTPQPQGPGRHQLR